MAEKFWKGTRYTILAVELVLVMAWAGCAAYSRTTTSDDVVETRIGLTADRDVLDLLRRSQVTQLQLVPAESGD